MLIKLGFLLTFSLISGDLIGLRPKPKLDGRIVGGFLINITQVPWQVSLRVFESHLCGASIISSKWILTAAHCTSVVDDQSAITIRVGITTLSEKGVIHKVKRIIQNSQYNENTTDYDFAMLELEQSIEFNDRAQAIALPSAKYELDEEIMVLVTGWGDTEQGGESSEYLQGVEIPIVNQKICAKVYRGRGRVTPRMVCAGYLKEGGKDSCQGDSGGPMIAFDDSTEIPILIGIVSWGIGCAEPGAPGVYARVQTALDWIYSNTRI